MYEEKERKIGKETHESFLKYGKVKTSLEAEKRKGGTGVCAFLTFESWRPPGLCVQDHRVPRECVETFLSLVYYAGAEPALS